jgi:hypothetical protein
VSLRPNSCPLIARVFSPGGSHPPGSREVYLCIDALKRTWQQKPTYVVAAFIHEMLHTLGLGENPPSTQEITRRVLQQCREE